MCLETFLQSELPEAEATSCTSMPASLAINPRIANTTSPLKNDVKPTDATHRVVALWNNVLLKYTCEF